jgi:hypothetical protein
VSGELASWITNYGYPPGDLRRYGADTTGVSASDTALQHALAAAQASTGIVVWHPGGTILLTKTAVVPNGISIAGADRTACIFLYGGTGSAFQNINGPNSSGYGRVIFRNVQIKAKALVSNGAGIEINGGGFAFYEIDTCQVTGPFQYGVILDACEVAHVHHNIIENSSVSSSINIWLVNGNDRVSTQDAGFTNAISITDNQINGATVGIADDGGSNHSFIDNNINGNSVPISIAGVLGFLIDGNEMENGAVYTGQANVRLLDTGISSGASKGACHGGEIRGNTFGANMVSGSSASLKFMGGTIHTGISVHGNWFRFNSGQSADIDVTKLGNSTVGPNHATASAGQHYMGVHNDSNGNTLLPPQDGYPGGFSQAATVYGDTRYPYSFSATVVAPLFQIGASSGPRFLAGSGSPMGVVLGNPGDLYLSTSGGAGTTLWVKESGSGTTSGWVGK